MEKPEADPWGEGGSAGKVAAYVCFGIGGFLVLLGVGVLIYLIYVKRRGKCCGPKKPISFYQEDIGELPAEHHVNPRVRIANGSANSTVIEAAMVSETLKKPAKVHLDDNPRVHVITETGDVYEDNLISDTNITKHYKSKNPKVRVVEGGEVFEDYLISDSLDHATKVHDYGGPVQASTVTKINENHMIVTTDQVDYAKTNGSVGNTLSRESANHLRGSFHRSANSAYSAPGRGKNKKRKKNKKNTVYLKSDVAQSEPVLGTNKKANSPNWILKGNVGQGTGRNAKSLGHGTVLTSNRTGRKKKYMMRSSIPMFTTHKKRKHQSRSYTPMHGSVNSLHSAGSFYVYSATPILPSKGHRYVMLDTGRPHSRTHVRKWIHQQQNDNSLRRISDPTHAQSGTADFESPRSEGVVHRVVRSEETVNPPDNVPQTDLYRPDSSLSLPLHLRWSPSMRKDKSRDAHSDISDSSFAIATNTLPKKRTAEGAATANAGERKPSPIPNGDVLDMTRL